MSPALTNAPTSAGPPSTMACITPSEPRRPTSSSSGPCHCRQGCTLAPSGAVPSTTRRGCTTPVGSRLSLQTWPPGGVQWRTVRLGSSALTVPDPTITASEKALSRWASLRASNEVIHCDDPSGAAVRPSRLAASLATIQGRPVRRWCRYG